MCDQGCDWDYVECNTHKHVVSILLSNEGLSGTIPVALSVLTSLKILRLDNNKFEGPIPRTIAAMPHLQYFDVSNNRLSGRLPYFESTFLKTINLSSNDFHGAIPNKFIASTSLEDLRMGENRLASTIPPSLFNLIKLDTLDISSNKLHGSIPSDIGKLQILQHLHLSNNFLVGPIPHTLATANPVNGLMGDLLETIHLQNNFLSGTIPLQLEYLPNLRELVLHDNKLTGEVPGTICSENVNAFFYEGAPATPGRNYCDAIACPADEVALDGTDPCVSCNNAFYNPYIGQTRSCNTIVNQREILKKFYESTTDTENGKSKWNGKNNWEDDDTFICDFTGVECDMDNHVIAIDLRGRGLKGVIPDSIGFLKYLQRLDLSDNDLEGYLPSDLQWTQLEEIDISGNKILGTIPPKLCDKSGLNGNGLLGVYSCDHIACPVGTFSSIGRDDGKPMHKCLPCHHNNPMILGNTSCRRVGMASESFGVAVLFVVLVLGLISFCGFRYSRRNRIDYGKVMERLEMQQPITAAELGDGRSIGERNGNSMYSEGHRRTRNSGFGSNIELTSGERHRTLLTSLPYPEAETSSVISRASRNSNRSNTSDDDERSLASQMSQRSNVTRDAFIDAPRLV